MRVSFMPIAFVIILFWSCVAPTVANRPPKVNASMPRDRQTRPLHLSAVRLDKRVLGGVVLAQGLDRGAPVLMADLHRRGVERGFGLAVELVTPLAKRRRIVIEQLLLFQPLVD